LVKHCSAHGFDFIENGKKMPGGDPLQTSAYSVDLLDPSLSLVLGTRKRKEDEEDLEAFFEVRDTSPESKSNIAVCITHFMEGEKKWWRYNAALPNIGIAEGTGTETSVAHKADEWVNHIITAIKHRTTAAMLRTTTPSP
jgi:hypothetical protein